VRGHRQLGPIFRVSALWREVVILAGPEANRFLAEEGDRVLTVREFYGGLAEAMETKDYILANDGERHDRLRHLLARGFARRAIAPHLETLVALTREMVAGWKRWQLVRIVPALKHLITRQLGLALAGRDPGERVDDIQRFLTTLSQVTMLRTRPRAALQLPGFRRARARVLELAREVVADHRGRSRSDREPDVIDDMIAAVDAQDSGLSEDALHAVVIASIYLAGIDTAALSCAFMLYEVARRPELLAAIREECAPILARGGPALDDLKEMPLLEAAMLETFRLHPVAPAAPRTAARSFEFAGCRVEAGSDVLVGTAVTHFLPQYFPEPYQFDVSRYLRPHAEHKQPTVWAPFVLGAHSCLGARFAEAQIMTTMATLLSSADLVLEDPTAPLRLKIGPSRGPHPSLGVWVANNWVA
ncbi:MAG: cytochrome P450, partial [Candidatus Binatia bacterium]